MLIHPISITHEDTFMPKKIRNFFRKSPRPIGGEDTGPTSVNCNLVTKYRALASQNCIQF